MIPRDPSDPATAELLTDAGTKVWPPLPPAREDEFDYDPDAPDEPPAKVPA